MVIVLIAVVVILLAFCAVTWMRDGREGHERGRNETRSTDCMGITGENVVRNPVSRIDGRPVASQRQVATGAPTDPD
jgi:hypothetical protein